MAHLCPWWLGWVLAGRWRRAFQPPEQVVGPYLQPGMTAIDVGSGMGYFTLAMAEGVGPAGRVIAVDLQPRMLEGLMGRAGKAGLADRITPYVCGEDSLGLTDVGADFVLLFAMVHEVPDMPHLWSEVAALLKPGGQCLLAEPAGHIKPPAFEGELADAARAGLVEVNRPTIRASLTALLRKPN